MRFDRSGEAASGPFPQHVAPPATAQPGLRVETARDDVPTLGSKGPDSLPTIIGTEMCAPGPAAAATVVTRAPGIESAPVRHAFAPACQRRARAEVPLPGAAVVPLPASSTPSPVAPPRNSNGPRSDPRLRRVVGPGTDPRRSGPALGQPHRAYPFGNGAPVGERAPQPVPQPVAPPSPLPLLVINQHPRGEVAPQHNRCHLHGGLAVKHCIDCRTPLCPHCHYLLVNGRAMCLRCGDAYRPTTLGAALNALVVISKLLAVLALMAAALLLLPLPLVLRAFVAVSVGVVLARFLLLSDQIEVEVREIKPRSRF